MSLSPNPSRSAHSSGDEVPDETEDCGYLSYLAESWDLEMGEPPNWVMGILNTAMFLERAWPGADILLTTSKVLNGIILKRPLDNPLVEYGVQAIEDLALGREFRTYSVPGKPDKIMQSCDAILCMLDDCFGPDLKSMGAIQDYVHMRITFLKLMHLVYRKGSRNRDSKCDINLPVPYTINVLKRKVREMHMPARPEYGIN